MKSKSNMGSPQQKINPNFNLAQINSEQDQKRKDLIAQIEKELGGKIVTYFANFGHPLGIIHGEDIMLIEEALSSIGNTKKLFLIMNSPGGHPDAAEKIIMICRSRCKEFYIIVPDRAKSAATMIALGTDKIIMSDVSELGPIDPIVSSGSNNFQAWAYINGFQGIKKEILEKENKPQIVQMYLPMLNKLDPTIMEICERATKDSKRFAEKWLKKHMFKNNISQAERTALALSESVDYLTHSKVINYKEAKSRLKLNIQYMSKTSSTWKKIWELYVRSQKKISEKSCAKIISSSKIEICQEVSLLPIGNINQ